MQFPENRVSKQHLSLGVGLSTTALMLLTALHHIYGAHIYETPWRTHVAYVSFWSTAIIWAGLLVFCVSDKEWLRHSAYWLVVLSVFVVPFAWIGLFEGVYNHLVKNVLYFTNTPEALRHRLFPRSIYHAPDDLIFELSGLLQVVLWGVVGYYLLKLIRWTPGPTSSGSE